MLALMTESLTEQAAGWGMQWETLRRSGKRDPAFQQRLLEWLRLSAEHRREFLDMVVFARDLLACLDDHHAEISAHFARELEQLMVAGPQPARPDADADAVNLPGWCAQVARLQQAPLTTAQEWQAVRESYGHLLLGYNDMTADQQLIARPVLEAVRVRLEMACT
jgi:hypothetical protein